MSKRADKIVGKNYGKGFMSKKEQFLAFVLVGATAQATSPSRSVAASGRLVPSFAVPALPGAVKS